MSFLTASSLFTFSSCADDHFNINPDVKGCKTIWENIEAQSDLSDFAYILENVPFSQNENGVTKETYKDILSGDQTFTIWAPKNGSYDFEYYKKLIATGTEENLKRVESEFIRNNMTRYTHIMNGKDSLRIDLFNNKVGWLNFAKNTFKGQAIITPNIASSNGVLHITKSPAPFEPNLYEYISICDNASIYKEFVMKNEETRFDEYSSTAGPTINGQATWVDSVTYKLNSYIRGCHGALLEREDSNYVMVIPTDKAINEKYDKVKSLFNYKLKYEQSTLVNSTDGKDSWVKSGEETILESELDSIVNFRTMDGIIQGSIFNANTQRGQIDITTLNGLSKADSIESTYGHTFKRTGTLNQANNKAITHESDDFAQMFGGKDPVRCSNGYAYVSDTWNFPSTMWAPTLEYKATNVCIAKDNKTGFDSGRESVNYYTESGKDSIVSYPYLQVYSTKTSNFTAYFAFPNVLSCKYDIYLVTLHNNSTNRPTYLKFRIAAHRDAKATQSWDDGIENLYQDGLDSFGGDASSKVFNFYTHQAEVDTVTTSPIKIRCESLTDTICIAKDYSFPYSYYGFSKSYPLLEVKSAPSNTEARTKYCREARIVSFILKPKREE